MTQRHDDSCGQERPNGVPDSLESSLDQLEDHINDTDATTRDAADRLWLRQDDVELVERMTKKGFVGWEYDTFINDLARYGHAVIRVWIHTGEAYRRAFELGRPVSHAHRPRHPVLPDDASALADLAVTFGLKLFIKKGLMQGQWQADGGASLRSYFIGSCLLTLSNACRSWKPDSPDQSAVPYDVVDDIPTQRAGDDPERVVLLRSIIAGLLEEESPVDKLILRLRAVGYTEGEVAEIVGEGATAKSVEHKIARARRRISRRRDLEAWS
ncbi:hypothetical protein EV385_6767 [Krasilnikovia cinnamomea]|uniref:DNA-directed RNA polymerase specialized sigma24 family protein n=1 Tax=Krasilnikovia cinnamomea TaxID=349313 RepID=A0A4Q7Z889_9ACTN|nr:hypothetical protein [Krasilnikovia cinnamomea]RZU46690.1 hypothetical protein EV385_6767 [Krasilnikovia cinnamomea]